MASVQRGEDLGHGLCINAASRTVNADGERIVIEPSGNFESVEDLRPFDADEFVRALFE